MHRYLVPGTWHQILATTGECLVPFTWYEVPEHLFTKSEGLSGVVEHLFVFGQHCLLPALIQGVWTGVGGVTEVRVTGGI